MYKIYCKNKLIQKTADFDKHTNCVYILNKSAWWNDITFTSLL